MCKKIMILGASELQLPAIKKAKELGLKSIVIDYDPNAIGIHDADTYYNVSTLDYDTILRIAKKEQIDGILTICSDRPMMVVAKVSEIMGLNSISQTTALLATNKAHMRDRLKKYQVPIPKYVICKTKQEYSDAVKSIELPFIVKPSDNSGSRGIVFVDKEEAALSAYEYAVENSLEKVVLVEEYMDGLEVSVEVFVVDEEIHIIQITDKITTGAPHFVEMGHTQPSGLSSNTQEEIKKVTKCAVKAIGIKGGPAHVELKVTSDGVKIVELGARLGGDFIATNLVKESTGIDLVKETILWTLGENVNLCKTKNQYAAIRYIGKLTSIRLDKGSLNLMEDLTWCKNNAHDVESSRDREFAFIVSGESEDILIDKIKKVKDILTYEDEKLYW